MNKKEEKSSWDELAKLLGTNPTDDTTQSLQPESVSNLPSERRASTSSRPVRPRHSDWNVLASELGLSLPVAPPPQSKEDEANPPRVEPDRPEVEANRRGPEAGRQEIKEDVQKTDLDIQLVAEEAQDIERIPVWDTDQPDTERPQPIEPSAEPTDLAAASKTTDPDQQAQEPPVKETRRRRRGGRRRSSAAKRAQTDDQNVPLNPEAPPPPTADPRSREGARQERTEPLDFADQPQKSDRDRPDETPASTTTRKKRRRRGGSRKSRREVSPADASADLPAESGSKIQASAPANGPEIPPDTPTRHGPPDDPKAVKHSRRSRRRKETEPAPSQPADLAASPPGQHVPEPDLDSTSTVADPGAGPTRKDTPPPDTRTGKSTSKRASHKNIPTWEETVHILIDNNLSSRTPRNRAQRSGSKGSRRGRKR